MNYKFTAETLYENTNRGLDIIFKYCPDAKDCENKKKLFKLRPDENTASASLILKENCYVVKDFGDKAYSPIELCRYFTGLSFYEALKYLYAEFGLSEGSNYFHAETTFTENTDKPLGWFEIIKNDKFENIDLVGRFLTEEIAAEYDFVSVKEYSFVVTLKKTGKPALCKIIANERFPIFAYTPETDKKGNAVTWAKIYQPADKKYKHSFVGKKPKRHIFGLSRLQKKYNDAIADFNKQIKKAGKDTSKITELTKARDEFKLDSVFNCSGGSDGLSLASLDYNVIWHNSESEHLDYDTYNILKEICHFIYNLPDIDDPGIKAAYATAENFWSLYTIYLPESIKKHNGKDLRDWIKKYSQSDKKAIKYHFANLIQGALRMKFFDRKGTKKIHGGWNYSYKLRFEFLCYFLNIKGFYTYEIEQKNLDNTAPEQIIFIQIDGNIVRKVSPRIIRTFAKQFLREKGQPIEVLELISMSTVFNENNLVGLKAVQLDFTNHTPESQFFFFKNNVAEITANEIKFHKHGKFANYVWEQSVKHHNILPEKPFFEIEKNEAGQPKIKILRNDSEYLNYLCNVSRIFWRKELEEPYINDPEAKEDYHNKNRFNIAGECLSEEEREIQNRHLSNKIYAIGYMLHRHKLRSFAKMLYLTDDKYKDLEEDANGGSGKSIFFLGFDSLLPNRKVLDGKNQNFTTDKHLLQGFTKENDYLLIEDAHAYFDVNFTYNWITGAIIVNPKFGSPYEVTFEEAGKIALLSNYGVRNFTDATRRRLMFVTTSDYYHVHSHSYSEERKVCDDFAGKDLFADWTPEQWNRHYSFLMQCAQIYLQNKGNEFKAPSSNLELNNIKASLGDTFISWADGYFTKDMVDVENENEIIDGTLNHYILRKEMYKNYMEVAQKGAKNATKWKKDLSDYCKSHNWTLNPKDLLGSDGLIKKPITDHNGKRQVLEHFYIRTPEVEPNTDVEI